MYTANGIASNINAKQFIASLLKPMVKRVYLVRITDSFGKKDQHQGYPGQGRRRGYGQHPKG